MKSYKNILITGGCGFMGSHFIRHLYGAYLDYKIYNLDALTYAGNPENLLDIEAAEQGKEPSEKRYQFVKGDVCDTNLLGTLFRDNHFSLAVHFAAETHVDRSHFEVADFIRTNIEGTRCIMEAVRTYGTPRFIHISTDEVYGTIPEGKAAEGAAFRPSNLYSASKAGADLLVQAAMKVHKIPALIVRGSNNYGPHQYPEKLIPMAISNMIEGKKIPIHGSGKHVRCWLHVKDFCNAVDLIAHNAPDHAIYNISGDSRTNLQILQLVADHLGKNLGQHTMHIADRPNADFRYAPDSGKLQKELGWSRNHSVEQSIAGVVDWYMEHKNWWQKIKATPVFKDYYGRQARAEWDGPAR